MQQISYLERIIGLGGEKSTLHRIIQAFKSTLQFLEATKLVPGQHQGNCFYHEKQSCSDVYGSQRGIE